MMCPQEHPRQNYPDDEPLFTPTNGEDVAFSLDAQELVEVIFYPSTTLDDIDKIARIAFMQRNAADEAGDTESREAFNGVFVICADIDRIRHMGAAYADRNPWMNEYVIAPDMDLFLSSEDKETILASFKDEE